jgi:uncharacterized protein
LTLPGGSFVAEMTSLGTVAHRGAEIHVPWLLVHGTADDVVPLQDAQDILARTGANAELQRVPGANHVFSDHTAQMVPVVVDWVRQLPTN